MKRHTVEWIKSMNGAKKVAEKEVEQYENMLEDLPRRRQVPGFRKNYVQPAKATLSKIIRARGRAMRLIKDLEEHAGEQ